MPNLRWIKNWAWAAYNAAIDYAKETKDAVIDTPAKWINQWIDYVAWNKDKTWENYAESNKNKVNNVIDKAKANVDYSDPAAQYAKWVVESVWNAADAAGLLYWWKWAFNLLKDLKGSLKTIKNLSKDKNSYKNIQKYLKDLPKESNKTAWSHIYWDAWTPIPSNLDETVASYWKLSTNADDVRKMKQIEQTFDIDQFRKWAKEYDDYLTKTLDIANQEKAPTKTQLKDLNKSYDKVIDKYKNIKDPKWIEDFYKTDWKHFHNFVIDDLITNL